MNAKGYGTSGPHSSLQSQTGEVHEVQFEVQRNCLRSADETVGFESFAVWVYWPPERPPLAVVDCDGKRYRLTPAGQKQMLARGFQGNLQYATVCEHMGRLIE